MEIQIKTSKNKSWGKCLVMGKVLGNSRKEEVQEHLETIYYFGWFRVIFKHDFKFRRYQ